MSDITEERWLSSRELSEQFAERGVRYSPNYLDRLACTGGGPEFCKFGHFRRYRFSKGWAWVEQRRSKPVRSTAELGSRPMAAAE